MKLPALYLIDCIVKTLPESTGYKILFEQNIVSTFINVFRLVCHIFRVDLQC